MKQFKKKNGHSNRRTEIKLRLTDQQSNRIPQPGSEELVAWCAVVKDPDRPWGFQLDEELIQ